MEDCWKLATALTEDKRVLYLGSRDFDQPGVPPRSVAGNKTTARLFRLCYGIKINDTQTGLRAIPGKYLERSFIYSINPTK